MTEFFSNFEADAFISTIAEDLYKMRIRPYSSRFRPQWRLHHLTNTSGGKYWLKKLMKKHKNNNERYQLFRLLIFNDVEPFIAVKWITMGGRYDKAAWRDLNTLIKRARNNEDKFWGGRLWNFQAEAVIEYQGRRSNYTF